MQAQTLILGYLAAITTELKSAISLSIKDLASLSNLGMKSMYSVSEKMLMNTTSELCKCLKWIYVLPSNVYKKIAGELMGAVFDHVCEKLLEVRSFSPSDLEAVLKFMKPLFEYEQILLESATKGPHHGKQHRDVSFLLKRSHKHKQFRKM